MSKNTTNINRAEIILWLTEMKEKGRRRIKDIRRSYMDGEIPMYNLNAAQRRMDMLTLLIKIFQTCQVDPEEMLDMLKNMKPEGKKDLFSNPKNPL